MWERRSRGVEETIEQQMRPFQSAVEAFSSAADMVSWAGICPGNHEGYIRLLFATKASTFLCSLQLSKLSAIASRVLPLRLNALLHRDVRKETCNLLVPTA